MTLYRGEEVESAKQALDHRVEQLKGYNPVMNSYFEQFAAIWRDLMTEVGLDPYDENVILGSVVTIDLIMDVWIGRHVSDDDAKLLQEHYENDPTNLIPVIGFGIVQHYRMMKEAHDVHD